MQVFIIYRDYQHTLIQKKVGVYQIPDSYFYNKYYPHKLDIKYLISEREFDGEFTYESSP